MQTAKEKMEKRLERLHEQLTRTLEDTAADLEHYAKRLREGGTAAGINGFGVLQSRTSTIEVLVGRYNELQDALDTLKAFGTTEAQNPLFEPDTNLVRKAAQES